MSEQNDKDLSLIIGGAVRNPPRKWLRPALAASIILLLIFAVIAIAHSRRHVGPGFVTTVVKQGDLAISITATGTLQPTNKVDVGSELSGTVAQVLADYNDHVKKGQVLAVLDPSKLKDQIAKSRATLLSAQSQADKARTDVDRAKASLARLENVARLSGGKLPATSELEDARINVASAQASLGAAQAAVTENAATLRSNETDLTKATIRSPINGMVMVRNIEPGQTVAASLQAPVLFTLAEDLTQMQLKVAVAEADVGQVKEKQESTFNVDAYPEKKYHARVQQVRYGSTVVDNVVTYDTILQVKNDDLTLRPGMTATADILVAARNNVLLVPAAALRFTPATGRQKTASKSVLSSLIPMPRGNGRAKQVTTTGTSKRATDARLWILRNGRPAPIDVSVGLSDGRNTEVSGEGLAAGTAVITDVASGKS